MNSEILKKVQYALNGKQFYSDSELCAVQSGRKQLAAIAGARRRPLLAVCSEGSV